MLSQLEASASLGCWPVGRFSEARVAQKRCTEEAASFQVLPVVRRVATACCWIASGGLTSTSQSQVFRALRLLAILAMGTISCGVRVWHAGGIQKTPKGACHLFRFLVQLSEIRVVPLHLLVCLGGRSQVHRWDCNRQHGSAQQPCRLFIAGSEMKPFGPGCRITKACVFAILRSALSVLSGLFRFCICSVGVVVLARLMPFKAVNFFPSSHRISS